MHELLIMPRTRGNLYHVRTSTTPNPYSDWCGFVSDQLTGVADIVVCSGKKPVVVGEVKGPSDPADGFYQCVSAMQVLKGKHDVWLLVRPFEMQKMVKDTMEAALSPLLEALKVRDRDEN